MNPIECHSSRDRTPFESQLLGNLCAEEAQAYLTHSELGSRVYGRDGKQAVRRTSSRLLCFQGTTDEAIAVLVTVALGSVFKFLPCSADDQVRSF